MKKKKTGENEQSLMPKKSGRDTEHTQKIVPPEK